MLKNGHTPQRAPAALAMQVTTTAPSDEELLRAVAQRDQESVGLLYDRYAAQMLGVASRILRDPRLAEDAVQETFLGIWRSAPSYDPCIAKPSTWMLRIAHHRAIDMLRRRRVTSALPEEGAVGIAALTTDDFTAAVHARFESARIHDALATLPRAQREAVSLAFLDGLPHREVAVRMQSPLGTAKSRIRLGLRALRSELDVGIAG